MKQKRQRWLILAHCYNMDGQSASHHITDKIPYFKKYGIEPVIISSPTGFQDKEVEHHQVMSPAPSGIRFELRHIITLKFGRGSLGKILRAIVAILIFPFHLTEKLFLRWDSHWSWHISAVRKGKSIIDKRKFEAIFVAGGASSAFLAAQRLSEYSGLPWIAEIYDPMIHTSWARSKMSYRWNEKMESIICASAKAVFWYTTEALAQARQRNPNLGDRGHLLRPGMKPPDFDGAIHTTTEKLVFSYFGGLTPERNLVTFCEGLGRFLTKRSELRDKIKINVYGGEPDFLSNEALGTLPVFMVCKHGRLEYDPDTGKSGRQRVLEEMRQSDVLLLSHGKEHICKLYIPGKVYEYLWARRPILGMSPEPECLAEVIPSDDHWLCLDRVEDIENAIEEIVGHWLNKGLADRPQSQAYSVESAVCTIVESMNYRTD